MKLSIEVSDLLFELIGIESVDQAKFLQGNADLLCQRLWTLYSKTSNQKSHDLIIKIIDKGGYSFFGASQDFTRRSDVYKGDCVNESETGFELNEDDFLDLLPVNGYFH